MGYKRYEKYRDSGVEWIGEIPEHWKVSKIKFTTYVKGRIGWQGLRADEFIDEGPYLVTGTDFIDGLVNWDSCYHISMERYNEAPPIQLKENDLLITKDGTIGKVAIVKNKPKYAILNSGIFVTRPQNSAYLTEFMYWILNSQVFNRFIEYMSLGSTIVHLYQQTFENFSFPITNLNEQKTIVDFLNKKTSEIDGLIADKEKLIELLQEIRQAIITEAVTKGLDPNVPMKDSGVEWIGKIPEHWAVKKLKYLAFLKSGESITSEMIEEQGEYPVYGGNGLRGYTSSYTHEGKHVLIGRQGALCGNINYAQGKFWASEHAVVVTPLEEVDLLWLGELLRSMNLNQYSISAAQPGLSVNTIQNIFIPVPPYEEQRIISYYLKQKIADIEKIIQDTRKQIITLKEYRQSLIYEAVTGKIDVRDFTPETEGVVLDA